MENTKSPATIWDKLGILLSALCLIHCILGPILLVLIPSISQFFTEEWIHIFLFIFVVLVAGYVFLSHYKYHRSKSILVSAFSGIFLLSLGLFLHDSLNAISHALINLPGSLLLIWAHWQNLQICKCTRGKTC